MDAKERVTIYFKEGLYNLSKIQIACVDELIKQSRNDALEEAAMVVEKTEQWEWSNPCSDAAKAIRALKEK